MSKITMRPKYVCGECQKRIYKKPKNWEDALTWCRDCAGVFCVKHIRSYVDGSNEAITNSSYKYCLPHFFDHHDKNGDALWKRSTT